jgi:hypothetical protein
MRAVTLGFCLALMGIPYGSACSSPLEPQEALISLIVRDERGRALANTALEIDGVLAMHTDAQGRARVTLQGRRPKRVHLQVRCPHGHQAVEPRSVPVSPHGRQPPLELDFVCRPASRSLLIVVRAPLASGLPVLADGASIGSVGPDGTLHALLQRPPGSELRLTLDTSAEPRLAPQQPVREITVGDSDELVVFDQTLTRPEREAKPPSRSRSKAPAHKHVPYAIGSSTW